MPGKRLIICCDGTWQDSDGGTFEVPTNITRLARSIEPVAKDGTPQIVYYQSGVGTGYGVFARVIGGATGSGLSEHVREAYGFLANNYCPGDSVILLGFSRGAFTARSICGLVNRVGILTRKGMDGFYQVFKDYCDSTLDKQKADELAQKENGTLVHKKSNRITAISCFDTVGSLGIPSVGFLTWRDFNKQYQFHDTGLNLGKVEYAFHALALDENRGPFTPTMWEVPPKVQQELTNQDRPTNLRQCWFPGVHTNIGGGYDDQEIADITLAWMVQMLESVAGVVDFCENYLDSIVQNSNESDTEWAEGKVYDSAEGIFKLVSGTARTPGQYTPTIPGSTFEEYMHPCVRVRRSLMNKDPKKPKWFVSPSLGGSLNRMLLQGRGNGSKRTRMDR